MSTLYIRLPSKAAAGSAQHWHTLACPFALVSKASLAQGGTIERQGQASISELSGAISTAQRVLLLLAASDVTLLCLPVPPLPPAKLKAALPNLVEDRLIADPADCVVVAGGLSEGLRTIAVVQRSWIEMLVKTVLAHGARQIAVLPAQLCLPCPSDRPGGVTAAIDQRDEDGRNTEIDLTLRLSEKEGIGLAIAAEKDRPATQVVIGALCELVAEAPITLYVPQTWVRAYQEAVNESVSLGKRISVSADNWSRWIDGAHDATLDLTAGLSIGAGPKFDWRPWRWSVALAVAVLAINAAALNIDWWRLSKETDTLRKTMLRIYKSAYPKETVIIDPLAQLQQKIAVARHDSGLPSQDDFTPMIAAFGQAWSSAVTASGKNAAIGSLDYRDRSLFVHFKAGSASPIQPVQAALSKYGLALDPAPDPSGAVVWQIRSMK